MIEVTTVGDKERAPIARMLSNTATFDITTSIFVNIFVYVRANVTIKYSCLAHTARACFFGPPSVSRVSHNIIYYIVQGVNIFQRKIYIKYISRVKNICKRERENIGEHRPD